MTYIQSIDFLTARSLGRDAVRRRLRRLDGAAWVAVGFVAVGLVLEDHAIVGIALSIENAARLVTAGVAAEFVIHWLHSRVSKREQQLSDAESAEQQQEIVWLGTAAAEAERRHAEAELEIERLQLATAKANERAAEAALSAAEAQLRAAEATQGAAEAGSRAAQAGLRAIGAEARAMDAEERAAEANRKLAPRRLTPRGAAALVERLKPFSRQLVQIVKADQTGSPEIEFLAQQLWGTLSHASWEASWYPEPEPADRRRPFAGVLIQVARTAEPRVVEAANALKVGLHENDIEATVLPWLRGDESSIVRSAPSDGEPLADPKLIRVCVYRKY